MSSPLVPKLLLLVGLFLQNVGLDGLISGPEALPTGWLSTMELGEVEREVVGGCKWRRDLEVSLIPVLGLLLGSASLVPRSFLAPTFGVFDISLRVEGLAFANLRVWLLHMITRVSVFGDHCEHIFCVLKIS